jgi:hypothetical protein
MAKNKSRSGNRSSSKKKANKTKKKEDKRKEGTKHSLKTVPCVSLITNDGCLVGQNRSSIYQALEDNRIRSDKSLIKKNEIADFLVAENDDPDVWDDANQNRGSDNQGFMLLRDRNVEIASYTDQKDEGVDSDQAVIKQDEIAYSLVVEDKSCIVLKDKAVTIAISKVPEYKVVENDQILVNDEVDSLLMKDEVDSLLMKDEIALNCDSKVLTSENEVNVVFNEDKIDSLLVNDKSTEKLSNIRKLINFFETSLVVTKRKDVELVTIKRPEKETPCIKVKDDSHTIKREIEVTNREKSYKDLVSFWSRRPFK